MNMINVPFKNQDQIVEAYYAGINMQALVVMFNTNPEVIMAIVRKAQRYKDKERLRLFDL